MVRYIQSIGRKPEELSHILLTHSHPDHTGGVNHVAKMTHAELIAHGDETRLRRGNRLRLGDIGVSGVLPGIVPILGRSPVVTPVQDGDVLPIGDGVRVVHTPGHTNGSVCFLDESTKTLFSGDTIFSDSKRISRSVAFPGYDAAAYRASLERLAGIDFLAVCGGHGSPLLEGGADVLADLLATRPDLPTWSHFIKSMPRRLRRSLPLTGEDPWAADSPNIAVNSGNESNTFTSSAAGSSSSTDARSDTPATAARLATSSTSGIPTPQPPIRFDTQSRRAISSD